MTSSHPFLHAAWAAFVEAQWGYGPLPLTFTAGHASLDTLLFTDARGRVVRPPIVPYLPILFHSPATTPNRRGAHWLEVATPLAQLMHQRGIVGTVPLDPLLLDARPWGWTQCVLHTVYTYHLTLPHADALVSDKTRQEVRRAIRAGYRCVRAEDPCDVIDCLRETEARQGFSYGLTVDSLRRLWDLMGPDRARSYVCHAPDGTIATARVVLWTPGGPAIDWLAGTRSAHLDGAATKLMVAHVLSDLTEAGATLFDFGGADLASVATMKQRWGGTLVPFTAIQQHSWRSAVAAARDALKVSPLGQRLLGPWRALKRRR